MKKCIINIIIGLLALCMMLLTEILVCKYIVPETFEEMYWIFIGIFNIFSIGYIISVYIEDNY